MTAIIINLICLATGFTICSVLSWSVYRRHKQAWQKEYRRLMGGIIEIKRRNTNSTSYSRQEISAFIVRLSNGATIK